MRTIFSNLRKKSGIYTIECTVNGMKYIGQSRNLGSRITEHFAKLRRGISRNKRLLCDFELYGENAFAVHVDFCQVESLDDREREKIAEAREDGKCYNVFSGGRTGYVADDEFRERAREIHTGQEFSDECIALHSEIAKKQWENSEYRNTMINSAKRQWMDPEYRKIMRDAHLKIRDDQIPEIKEKYNNGMHIKELAKEYGVSSSTMQSAIHRDV